MLRFAWSQLRGRPRRTLALLAGVVVATAGFTVLSASAATQQLRVEGTVDANYRSAYDILVRPKDSRTALEQHRGLVAPNYLSGRYGGITMKQLDQVRGVGHVAVAAPVAMLGYTFVPLVRTYDLTDQVDPTAPRQLLRVTPDWTTDRGLTVVQDAPQYVYLTRNQLIPSKGYPQNAYVDGTTVANGLRDCVTVLEVEPDRSRHEICAQRWQRTADNGLRDEERTSMVAVHVTPDGRFVTPQQGQAVSRPSDRLTVTVRWQVAVLTAAIDPVAEARLVGLDDAVVDGRYLSPDDEAVPLIDDSLPADVRARGYRGIPSLIANTTYVDEQMDVSVERLGAAPSAVVLGAQSEEWTTRLNATPGAPTGASFHEQAPPGLDETATTFVVLFQPGPVDYRSDEAGVLRPRPRQPDENLWKAGINIILPPRVATGESLRPVHQIRPEQYILGSPPASYRVGTFDPRALRGFTPLAGVPMETYQAPEVSGADARSRALLGDEPLLPNSNPAGYLTTPPLVLTNLNALKWIPPVMYDPDPISAIRVRVAGVTGADARSEELVRSTAEKIAATTGLDVDITIGASPAPQTVVLPAGAAGRPELTLTEGWSQKGAAVAIVQAADRKSLLLFGLILLVCTLFLGNAVAAAVRDRRRELAVLACLGWPAGRLAGLVFTEVTAVGLVAGLLAGGAAAVLPAVPLSHAALALPVGLGVALLAAAPPALAAGRARPWTAVQPRLATVRRARRRNTLWGLALSNLWRVPGRTALGVGALAVGVGALIMLVVIAVVFRNDVIGTLLGDAVAVRVRSVDVFAAITAVSLGVLMVADVLYINVRERAAELAALWAAGWSDRALIRLVGYEGVAMGLAGGTAGAVLGLLGVFVFVGHLGVVTVAVAFAAAAGATVVAGLAAVVPALVLRRLPLSTVLAEE